MVSADFLQIVFWGLQVRQWFVIIIILATFISLIFTKIRPEMAFLGTIMAFYLSGVLTVEESFSGLSNASVVIVGVMFAVIAGLKYTGALAWMVNRFMGRPKTYTGAIVRMMLPASMLSAFTSNTATTLLFQDAVKCWARELKLSASQLLIPLAYAASMGGALTMLGSPCNLVILGLYEKATGDTINLFAPFPVAICGLLVMIGVIILMKRVLPIREAVEKEGETDLLGYPQTKKTFVSIAILVAMIVCAAFELASLAACSFIAAILMVVTKCCNVEQLKKEIDWDVILVFAGSISIGVAVAKVGLDALVVKSVFSLCGTNPYMVLAVLCVITSLLTEVVSDTACAALSFPIAYEAATTLGVNPMTFSMAIMFAACNNYSTPVATPPNTIVYMSGGYRFFDFFRIGLVLKVVMLALTIFLVPVVFPL